MNVLWGRVVVLGVVLLLVFLLGRATSGSSAEVDELQERLADREAEIDQLVAANREAAEASPSPAEGETTEGEAAAGGESTDGGAATTTPTPTVTASVSPSPAANTEAQTYTVRSGDNFSTISNRFYGSASFAKCIQTANQVADAGSLQAGRSITIPPKPAAPCT